MKLPAVQWYPGDWRKDPGIQALSYEERGVWFELLMLMHDCDDRGKLILNGKPITNHRLGIMLRLTEAEISQHISQFISLGVASVCETTGSVMCRRMVRDEDKRKKLSGYGRLGGNPEFEKGKSNPYHKPTDKPLDKPNISPSSSSSSSSSDVTPLPPTEKPPAILTPDDVGYWVDLIMELYPMPADSRSVYRWVDDNDNRLSAKGKDHFLNFMTEVQIGLEEWAAYWASRGNEFVPDVMKWLHGNGWKKHPPKPKPLLDGPMYDDGRPL